MECEPARCRTAIRSIGDSWPKRARRRGAVMHNAHAFGAAGTSIGILRPKRGGARRRVPHAGVPGQRLHEGSA